MRSSISAQSCDSVPPAPGWIVTMALLRSCSPPSIFLVSPASTCALSSSSARARSSSTGSPACAHSTSTARSSTRVPSARLRSISSSSRRRRCITFCAASWSFQKSGSATRAAILASSSSGRAASKIAPQILRAAREVFVSAELLVELKGHKRPMCWCDVRSAVLRVTVADVESNDSTGCRGGMMPRKRPVSPPATATRPGRRCGCRRSGR